MIGNKKIRKLEINTKILFLNLRHCKMQTIEETSLVSYIASGRQSYRPEESYSSTEDGHHCGSGLRVTPGWKARGRFTSGGCNRSQLAKAVENYVIETRRDRQRFMRSVSHA